MIALNPPAGMRNLRASGQILKRADGSYSVPDTDAPGLLALGWTPVLEPSEIVTETAPEIPEIRKTKRSARTDKDDRS